MINTISIGHDYCFGYLNYVALDLLYMSFDIIQLLHFLIIRGQTFQCKWW